MAITFDKTQLTSATIFDDLKKVYFCKDVIEQANQLSNDHELIQLPITEDGVTLNMGGVNTTFKKLNTGEIWGSTVDRDDPEVSFNVAAVSKEVNDMFMGTLSAEKLESVGFPAEAGASVAPSFDAQGYSLELKVKNGSLWFPSENGEGWIILPKIKMYGGLNGTDDSNTAYYACQVTPSKNDKGASIYILSNSKTAVEPGS